jgi:hypothetical protein
VATRFSEWQWGWSGVHSLVRKNEDLLEEKVVALVYKTEIYGGGAHRVGHVTLLCPQKLSLKFTDQ